MDHSAEYFDFEPVLECMEDLAEADEPEEQQYFYHPDHLGSSAFITDIGGDVEEHLQYLPFGESFVFQKVDWETRYTFSAKEKDKNTGFSYFGARYYDSEVSVWLSVDPMSDEYPSTSPFMYVRGNPVRLIDPNGLWDKDTDGNWVAKDGDSWWKLHKQSGMSWKETIAYAKKYNAEKGRDNWKFVGVGDKVTLPGSKTSSESNSSGESTSATPSNSSTPSTTNNSDNNSSNSPTNLAMQEELGYSPTPYGDFSTSVSNILEPYNPDANQTINVNRFEDPISITHHLPINDVTVGSDRITISSNFIYYGFNTKNQLIIGIETPRINGTTYSTEVRMNPQQAINLTITAAALILTRRYVPPVSPVPVL